MERKSLLDDRANQSENTSIHNPRKSGNKRTIFTGLQFVMKSSDPEGEMINVSQHLRASKINLEANQDRSKPDKKHNYKFD